MAVTIYPEFGGTVAVVTGACQGIGAAVVKALSDQGVMVVGLDIQYEKGLTPKANYWCLGVDVSDAAAVNTAVDEIELKLGPIDYCVSAAGILFLSTIEKCTQEQWLHTFSVNTYGAFNVCQAVARKMKARRCGAIVAVSSNAANTARINMGAYAASKAAVTQFIRCLALEMAEHNVRCNIVAPGSTDTPMQRQLWSEASGEQKVIQGSLAEYRLGIPLGRIASAEGIAKSILFLLSNQSSQTTMASLTVDGGATLGL